MNVYLLNQNGMTKTNEKLFFEQQNVKSTVSFPSCGTSIHKSSQVFFLKEQISYFYPLLHITCSLYFTDNCINKLMTDINQYSITCSTQNVLVLSGDYLRELSTCRMSMSVVPASVARCSADWNPNVHVCVAVQSTDHSATYKGKGT